MVEHQNLRMRKPSPGRDASIGSRGFHTFGQRSESKISRSHSKTRTSVSGQNNHNHNHNNTNSSRNSSFASSRKSASASTPTRDRTRTPRAYQTIIGRKPSPGNHPGSLQPIEVSRSNRSHISARSFGSRGALSPLKSMQQQQQQQQLQLQQRQKKALVKSPRSEKSKMSIASEASRLSKIINNPIFFEEHTGSEFELMHIKVTLYGLTGILCEKKKERKSRKSEEHLPRKLQPSTQNSLPSSVSSLSSNGSTGIPKTTTESEQDEMFASATHAVVTFKRNVSNSATSISSHLPSMPIGDSSSSFGFVKRYMASWPAEKASPMLKQEDTQLLDQSTFEVQRVMMKESYTPENGTGSADNIANYAYESIELQVHLKRGVEMIPLGMATLVISGEEEGPRRAHLPVKPVSYKGKKMIVSNPSTKSKTRSGKASRLFKKSARKPHFPSYPSEFFTLDETASLKIAVQVIPHEALKETGAARARRVKEEEQRKKTLDFTSIEQVPPAVETETDSDYSLVAGDSRVEGNKARSIFSSPCTPQNQIVEPLTPKTTGFFCANLCLTEPSNNFKMLPNKAKALPPVVVSESSFDATEASGSVNENRYLGKESAKSFESSVLSSVSESESESESEEDEGVHLNRRIVIRNR